MYMHSVCIWCPRKLEENVRSPGTRVVAGFQPTRNMEDFRHKGLWHMARQRDRVAVWGKRFLIIMTRSQKSPGLQRIPLRQDTHNLLPLTPPRADLETLLTSWRADILGLNSTNDLRVYKDIRNSPSSDHLPTHNDSKCSVQEG